MKKEHAEQYELDIRDKNSNLLYKCDMVENCYDTFLSDVGLFQHKIKSYHGLFSEQKRRKEANRIFRCNINGCGRQLSLENGLKQH
jgi:hypothetical protein